MESPSEKVFRSGLLLQSDGRAGEKARHPIQDGNGNAFAHTLNNTVVAPPRMLFALLENNLEYKDGKYSVRIPKALQPYMGGTTVITEK